MDFIEFFFSTAPEQLPRTVVSMVITAVGLYSLIDIWRAWRELRAEDDALHKFEATLSKRTSAQDPTLLDHPENGRNRIQDARKSISDRSIISQRVDALFLIERAGDDPETSAIVSQLVSQFERRLSLVRWLANAVVLLGLFGTLLGLSTAVSSVQNLVGAPAASVGGQSLTSPGDIADPMTGAIRGLGTAFSATLLGLTFAILIGFLVIQLRRRQTAYVERIEMTSRHLLYPHFRSSPSDALSRAARHLAQIEANLEGSLKNVANTLNSVITGIQIVVDEVKTQGESLSRTATGILDESRSQSNNLFMKWDRVLSHQRAVLGDPDVTSLTLPDVAQRIANASSSVQGMSETIDRIVPKFEEAVARQLDLGARDLHETMHKYSQGLTDTVDRQSAGMQEQIAQLRVLLPGIGEGVSVALRQHEVSLTEHLAPATQRMSDSLDGARDTTVKLRDATDALHRLIAQVDVTLRRAAGVPATTQSTDTDRIVAAIADLRAALAVQPTQRAAHQNGWDGTELPVRPISSGGAQLPDTPIPAPAVEFIAPTERREIEPGYISKIAKKLFG